MSFKKVIIWISYLIGIGVLIYIGFVIYVIFSLTSGCGMDDGPFVAKKISPINITQNSHRFRLSNGNQLVLTNRNDSLSPILTFIEKGKVKWTLDTDVKNTKGYEKCSIWKLSDLKVDEGWFELNLTFYAN